MQDSIKYDQEKTAHTIEFLYTLVYIDKNKQLLATLHTKQYNYLNYMSSHEGARGVMVIVVGDTSSNPGRECLHFT